MARMQIEKAEQKRLVRWFRLQYPRLVMCAIPNGGRRDILEAHSLLLEGVTPGMPDLLLLQGLKGLNGLFIEMKRPKEKGKPNPVVSPSQKAMIAYLLESGYGAVVCYGFDEARSAIVEYLS